jgi:hypothetical protein
MQQGILKSALTSSQVSALFFHLKSFDLSGASPKLQTIRPAEKPCGKFGTYLNLSSNLNKSIIVSLNTVSYLEVISNLTQRKTQTAHYWQKQFTPTDQDIEAIYNQILEFGQPIHLDDLAVDLVRRHCDAEELESRSELQQGKLYQPKERYTVDDRLIFPAMDFTTGTVVATRDGQHPDHGPFTVVSVDFAEDQTNREFVASFKYDHPLNAIDQSLSNLQGLMAPEELYTAYQEPIYSKVKNALDSNEEFVEFHDQYFLLGLLSELLLMLPSISIADR